MTCIGPVSSHSRYTFGEIIHVFYEIIDEVFGTPHILNYSSSKNYNSNLCDKTERVTVN